jgi:hypothetical protein
MRATACYTAVSFFRTLQLIPDVSEELMSITSAACIRRTGLRSRERMYTVDSTGAI